MPAATPQQQQQQEAAVEVAEQQPADITPDVTTASNTLTTLEPVVSFNSLFLVVLNNY